MEQKTEPEIIEITFDQFVDTVFEMMGLPKQRQPRLPFFHPSFSKGKTMNAQVSSVTGTTDDTTPGASDGSNKAWLSVRIWHGRTTEDLEAMGIRLTGELKGNFIETILPPGWKVVQSEVSMFQRQLLDDQGRIRARLFDQPGSAGGGMEMCLEDDFPQP